MTKTNIRFSLSKKSAGLLAGAFLLFTGNVFAQDAKINTSSGTLGFWASLNGTQTFALSGPSDNGTNDPKVIEGFGLRYYVADKWALRGLASFGTNTVNDSTHSTLWGLGLAVEYHMHQVYSTDIYVSAGAGYKSVSTKNLTLGTVLNFKAAGGKGAPLDETPIVNPGDWHANAFGFSIAAGFEWHFLNNFAIGSEYSFGLVTSSVTRTINGTEQNQYMIFPAQTAVGFSGGANIHFIVTF